MPIYQFTVTSGSTSALRKQEIAQAVTKAHCAVTGAPEHYVNCSFVEVPADAMWQGREPRAGALMIGIVRQRPEELTRELLLALGRAWAEATGEPFNDAVMGLTAIPNSQALENGALLGAPEDD